MEDFTTIVGIDGQATIECPGCGQIKASPVDAFKGRQNAITVFCSCGREFSVILDFRKASRMEVDMSGFFSKMGSKGDWGYMKVVDLSLGGLGMKVVGKHDVKQGDDLQIEFTLDSFPPSVVRKRVVVVRIQQSHFNCKFVDAIDVHEPLARYLLF